MSALSRSELLARLKALKLERATTPASSTSGSSDAGGDVPDMAGDVNHDRSNGFSEDEVTKLGMPAVLKQVKACV